MFQCSMELLTVRNLAAMLGVKEKTLYQWAGLGQIPHIRLNGSIRFDLEDIKTWVDNCKKVAQAGYNPVAKLEARKGGIRAK